MDDSFFLIDKRNNFGHKIEVFILYPNNEVFKTYTKKTHDILFMVKNFDCLWGS